MTNTQAIMKIYNKSIKFDFKFLLKRFSKEHPDVPKKECKIILNELLKYLAISHVNDKDKYAIFGIIDDMWHVFVLHTKEYREFCESAYGSFVDHVPAPAGRRNFGIGRVGYNKLIEDYAKVFKGQPLPKFWPSWENKAAPCGACGRNACGCGGSRGGGHGSCRGH